MIVSVVALLLLTTSCRVQQGDDPTPAARTAVPRDHGPEVVVASFNFAESRLLAEIYAAVLEQARIPVRRELDLGPRELVSPALLQGRIDLLPEYLGTALAAADPVTTPRTSPAEEQLAALRRAVGIHGVRVLAPAPAQNQNAVVVTRETAERLALTSVSDLLPHAYRLALGGPPECPFRQYCGVGLTDVYDLAFGSFVALDGADQTRRALAEGVVDVGIMFTTDGSLAGQDLVALADDRHLQPPEHVVPLVRAAVVVEHGDTLVSTLDAVSSRLTTTALRLLNWRVTVAGRDARSEAEGWLTRQGLLPR